MPKRFHNNTSSPHILIRKNHRKKDNETSICSHDFHFENVSSKSTPSEYNKIQSKHAENITKGFTKVNFRNAENLKRKKRETFPDGAPAFVETAVFVDKDLFDHMKTNYPVDTERELIRFVLAMINAVSNLLTHVYSHILNMLKIKIYPDFWKNPIPCNSKMF